MIPIRRRFNPISVELPVRDWIVVVGDKTAFIEPGSLWENGYIESFSEQPIQVWLTVEQSPRADVVANLPGCNKEVQRPPFAVSDGMQLGNHAALGSANKAATPPFYTPKLDAVRLREERGELCYMLVTQPEKIAHVTAPFSKP